MQQSQLFLKSATYSPQIESFTSAIFSILLAAVELESINLSPGFLLLRGF
jgi:hypothetical protein